VTAHPASSPLVVTIFILTYLALALGRIPGLRIDRAGIALVGAAAMLACGVLSMRDAAKAVDYETIVLLFGMMVVVAYLLFKPLMEVMPQKELAWLALSMSSTLAGNLTILGSVANLIVVENARRAGTELGFVEYLKVGVPLTVLTTLVGIA
jgi:Na+/H+ antiporter NhaD/arsenite permease-like protein